MWPKKLDGGSGDINGNAGDKGELAKLSQNGASKEGDVDNLLDSIKSENGSEGADKDVGVWARRAVYQVG